MTEISPPLVGSPLGTAPELATRYLGLRLRNPLVASPSPLTSTVDGVRALADAGVGAVVLPSLYEEEVREQQLRTLALTEPFETAHGEADGYLPRQLTGPDAATRYLRLVERAVAAVDVPVMASLNGSTLGGWTAFARQIQDAGAAALELNVYLVPGDPHTGAREVEDRHVEILYAVKDAVSLPVAVKLNPYFSSTGEMAVRLDRAGADGLVLFNRFVHPDVDPERLVVGPAPSLSSPTEARLPRAWIAVLWSHLSCSLAATTGVDGPGDVEAYLLAGADVVMTASALLRHGVGHLGVLLDELADWLRRKGYDSVDDARARLAVPHHTDATAYERAGFVTALEAARHRYGGFAQA
ncbi:MAG TPA: dihydroorotate dehydrogenase-like protein [Kineosporiaceae bacterium]|nr:dihydroorotate dehydrogenase-like protein [Kineosporiaceae bacterium]